MFISYDGSKMTSTIVNIDIEEISFCLACAIQKHVEYFQKSYEEGLIEKYSKSEEKDIEKQPDPMKMSDMNERLLVQQQSKQNKVNTPEKANPEEFKFNDVSDMDKSNDKSSTRYEAKFIDEDDDDINYDPDMVNQANNETSEQIITAENIEN